MQLFDLPIQTHTPPAWIDLVMADFDRFLIDHAACEQKASANAMSFVVKYPDRAALVEPMICLAKEELAHFHEVYRILTKRGLQLVSGDRDQYVYGLIAQARHGRDARLLDRLIIAAIVEARSCERLMMVGHALPAGHDLKDFYIRLAREEAGHYKVFLRIARHYFADQEVAAALGRFVDIETEVLQQIPLRAVVH